MKKNILFFIMIALITGFTIYVNITKGDQQMISLPKSKLTNEQAPVVVLPGLDGATYQVGGKRQKPVIITFFSSWCEACDNEAYNLQKISAQYHEQMDVYAVNVTSQDKEADVRKFVQEHQMIIPVLLDKEEKAAAMYALNVLPTTFFINGNGQIQEIFDYLPYDQMVKVIEKNLHQARENNRILQKKA